MQTRERQPADRARTLNEARAAEQRWRALVQGLGVIICESDPETGTFTFVNRRAQEMLGYPTEQWLEPGFLARVLHVEDRDRVIQQRLDALLHESSLDVEFRMIAADGRVIWVRDIAYVEPALPGRPARFRGLILDVTDRKLAERRLSAQHATMRAMTEANSVTEAASRVLEAICQSLDWEVGLFWMHDEEADVLRCVQTWAAPSERVAEFAAESRLRTFDRGAGLPGRAWLTQLPAWIPDVCVDDNFPRAAVASKAGLHGAFAIPVTGADRFLGVLEFFSSFVREPDTEVLELMASSGAQIGQFIERKRIEEQALFQSALLERQQEATLDGIIVVGSSGTVLSFNHRTIDLLGLDEETLVRRPIMEVFASIASSFADPEAFSVRARALTEATSVVREELRLSDGRTFEVYTAPLVAGYAALGRTWHFRDITDRKNTELEMRRASERFAFLAEASRILSSSLEESEVLNRLAALCVPAIADWCFIDMLAPDGRVERAAVSYADPRDRALAEQLRGYSPDPSGEHAGARALRLGVSNLRGSVDDEALRNAARDERHLELLGRIGARSAIAVPLVVRGRTIGVMSLTTGASRNRLDEADLELVEDLARRAALAVDNARLYAERSYVARTLQESLLPPNLPHIAGIDVAARYRPASEGTDVGGDFYDLFATGPREWAIVIGDVCGKGADAAAVTALGRYTLRAAAMQARKPARILATLNDAMLRQRSDRRFCTVAYGRLRIESKAVRLTLACGGHPQPILLRADGGVENIGVPGTLIGVFPDAEFRDASVVLGPGDAVVLYTDGVTEARASGAVFGEDRLRAVIADCAGLNSNAIAERIEQEVGAFQTDAVRDDVAILVLRVIE